MMRAFRAYKLAMENLDQETIKGIHEQLREEIRNRPVTVDDNALDAEVARVLRTRGCTIENHEEFHRVIFPQGTTCDLLLRAMSAHYLLTLPCGLKVKQIQKANRNYSLLFIVEGQSDAIKPDNTDTRNAH